MIGGARFDRERMAAAASDELIAATDIADLLVRRGVPFRECHGDRRRARAHGGRLRARPRRADRRRAARCQPALDGEVRDVLAQRSWLESKVSEGGTSLGARARAARARRGRC